MQSEGNLNAKLGGDTDLNYQAETCNDYTILAS